jgi:hypothetical protein
MNCCCRFRALFALFFSLCSLLMAPRAFAGDAAALLSSSVATGTPMVPRTIFTQTWTFTNTGTTTWTPTENGYTLNMLTNDSIGALLNFTNAYTSVYDPKCVINNGQSIPPGGAGTYSMSFIVPETPGPLTNYLQLNSASSVFFGPTVTVSIVVQSNMGSTNQYDRARAIAYANNYAGYVVPDGYFWTNGSDYYYFGPGAPVPTAYLGDDCAHFVSCCIGSEPHLRGGGLNIPSRATPTYGEPGAARLVNTCLIAPGYAKEVFSMSEMEPGDVVGWNWESDTNIEDLDHVTLYTGTNQTTSHAVSALDVSINTYFQSGEPDWVRHLIHIFDAPTLNMAVTNNNLVLSWTTNWTSYALYSSTSLGTNARWGKVPLSPKVVGNMNILTNTTSSSSPVFYKLIMP